MPSHGGVASMASRVSSRPPRRRRGACHPFVTFPHRGLLTLFESWVAGWTVGGYYQRKHKEDYGDEPPPFELKEEEAAHFTLSTTGSSSQAWLFRRNCKKMSPTGDANLLTSLLGLLRCLLTAAIPGPHDADAEEGGGRQKQFECCFLFALFWSTGCTSDALW